ncbi:MAG: AI-2E family transporter [Parachlamydiaceae bacterium]|nr:AI-2E family transporter [Parachlamydiaceae bacterium]
MNQDKNYNLIFAVLVIFTIFLSWYIMDILLLTFAAILLAIFLTTLSKLIQKVVLLPDSISMALVIVLLIALFGLIIVFMVPVISGQIQNLSKEIPSAWDKLKQMLNSTLNLGSVSSLYQKMDVQNLLPQGKNFIMQAANLFSTTFGLIGSVFVFTFMGIFLAFDPNKYKEGFISLIPSSKQEKARNVIKEMDDILQWWIIGKIFSMIIVGILTSFGLWFLSIPMALTLGLFAALLTFIPNIGPIVSAVPAVLVALIQSPISAMYVIALYLAIQSFESYVITPLMQGKTIALPPALVIFAQLTMGLVAGILGLCLATPLLAALSIIIKKLYIEKNHYKNSAEEDKLMVISTS